MPTTSPLAVTVQEATLLLATALSETCCGKIESLLLFYPVTKAFDDGSESWQHYGKGFGLDAEIMEAFNRAYTINADNRCSAISVGLCSDEALNMLPRTLLIAAERDILRDQGLNLAERTSLEFSVVGGLSSTQTLAGSSPDSFPDSSS